MSLALARLAEEDPTFRSAPAGNKSDEISG